MYERCDNGYCPAQVKHRMSAPEIAKAGAILPDDPSFASSTESR